jgi:signal transduction histidine kinase
VSTPGNRPIARAPGQARVGRAVARIVLAGACAALLAAFLGRTLERGRLGPTDADAFGRVQQSVRTQMDGIIGSLRDIGTRMSAETALAASAAADPASARPLFDRADDVLRAHPGPGFSVTMYGSAGVPLAWSGNPSELLPERIAGPESFFVTVSPLGLRLIYVKPLIEPGHGRRVGSVAAERLLSTATQVQTPAETPVFLGDTVVPVSLRARSEGGGEVQGPYGFLLTSPAGEPLVQADVQPGALSAARQHWRRGTARAALGILAVTLLLCVVPLAGWRAASPDARSYAGAAVSIAGMLAGSRLLLWTALAAPWPLSAGGGPGVLRLARPTPDAPFDFLASSLLIGALVVLAAQAVERSRLLRARRPFAPGPGAAPWLGFALVQLAAGSLVALLVLAYQRFLHGTLAETSAGLFEFSIGSWNAQRLSLAMGLIVLHAAMVWTAVLVSLLASRPWRSGRLDTTSALGFALRAAALAALVAVATRASTWLSPGPSLLIGAACLLLALLVPFARPRYRHASQALRLIGGSLALLVPVLLVYPSVFDQSDAARRRLVETSFAPEVLRQRARLQVALSDALADIDRLTTIPELVSATPQWPVPSGAAFLVWSQTGLAAARLTSAVELYGPDGSLVSRFALNLPEYASTSQPWKERSCDWDLFEEVSPLGSEERRLLHAGRGICAPGGAAPAGSGSTVGAVVVHVMLDYDALSFITSTSPYYEIIRGSAATSPPTALDSGLEFVAYGWGRRPLYSSGDSAWPLDAVLVARIAASRTPFWTTIERSGAAYSAYVLNDRAGIYVIGLPEVTATDHLTNLAELLALATSAYIAGVFLVGLWARMGGRAYASGRGLLREVRASFYRKLLLAFVAASIGPVVTLAFLTRAFSASQIRASVESAARRTAAVAQRVTEEVVSLQQRGAGAPAIPDDDILLWLSRTINQDVNIFDGPRLLATSQRDLFASGLLPVRTSSPVYRAIALDRLANFVGEDTAGGFPYMLAAAPVRVGGREEILTVPLALQQRGIEREIDELDRRILLAAVLFVLIGGGIGYWAAERIGDPVNRLTRATRRIARGDLTARVVRTSSDELRRLVEDFNRMAADLERQRGELERTHRLEAWAEMARQVAHEIKNPLTPIQLSAEHLLRVHRDRGEPLKPALQECVDVILSQVRLLRQIAAEFSSFASSPAAHPAPTSPAELLRAVIDPYRTGLESRVTIAVDVPGDLPPVLVDRTLLSRALTNIVENALHAMPGGGTLTVTARGVANTSVQISIADSGEGMDEDALRRAFEPYFSTRGTGTGLGLTIARRNIELNRGSIEVQSTRGQGTTVVVTLPISPESDTVPPRA